MKLFYIILGAIVNNRNTEQHDVYFGIAKNIRSLYPQIKDFWTCADLHIDCYQELKFADGYEIKIVENTDCKSDLHLYFINLGGYKLGHFEEFHEQHLMVDKSMADVIKRVKKTTFYKTMGFPKAVSHIDDKHGVDIDDIYNINDLLSAETKAKYSIVLEKSSEINPQNITKIGYLKI